MPEHKRTCTEHCGGCGAHFHGLTAFDRHRVDGYCADPETVMFATGRREGEPALQVWTHDGSCDKETGCWRDGVRRYYVEPVTIWQNYTTEEQREALSRLKAKKSDEVTA